MEKIVLSKEARSELNDKYGTWNVSRALNYRNNSFLCRSIRREAISQYNGIKQTFQWVTGTGT